jgi:hypothetical protein
MFPEKKPRGNKKRKRDGKLDKKDVDRHSNVLIPIHKNNSNKEYNNAQLISKGSVTNTSSSRAHRV